jgi:hypothetical protein
MKEEQHLTTRLRCTDAYRSSATRARDERSVPAIARNVERSVPAPAIDNDHLVIRSLLMDSVEQSR